MPELPEVEVVRSGLAPIVTGALITDVVVVDVRSIRRFPGDADAFATRLVDARIIAAVRRGKFLWFPLADADGQPRGDAIVMHLGMSGQALLLPAGSAAPRHERVRLTTVLPGRDPETLSFNDQRIFGYLGIEELVDTADGKPGGCISPPGDTTPVSSDARPPGWGEDAPLWRYTLPAHAAHIARDPLDPHFDDAAFIASTRCTSRAIKRVLLDQAAISGVGNIYADESLWRARIHPETPGSALSPTALASLLQAVRETLRDALAEGGTSFDEQYKNVNGASGYFERSLAVYGRAGQPCHRCGRPIQRMQFMNRSSHFCPKCQRPAR